MIENKEKSKRTEGKHESNVNVKYPLHDYLGSKPWRPVTVAGRSGACTLFARSEAGTVSSNPTQGIDV
jgi:hypothetical protein